MEKELERELQESLYLHRPLPLHRERSLESAFPKKHVLAARRINGAPKAGGTATVEVCSDFVRMTAALRAGRWPEGAPADGDYCNFGTARMIFSIDHEDWREFNRLRFWVRPQIEGARILHLNVGVTSRGEVPLPDPYGREGATVFDLQNGVWQECIWEFAAMPRDAVCELTFYVFCSGHDVSAGETLIYDFKEISLERVEGAEHELGWENKAPGIRLSTAGYWPEGKKTAVAAGAGEDFALINADTGKAVYSGRVKRVENRRGCFDVLDFSEYRELGHYRLESGGLVSGVFPLESPCEEALWKAVNFFYCQRCGFPVAGRHAACHQDCIASHNGVSVSYSGGWHDAGDQSQQTAQTGEIVDALFSCAQRLQPGSLLQIRIMEEAQWGLDFILRTRFGDGYRATSAGATRYTDGLIGNFDDVSARVHNHSFENFLFAGIEAHAAGVLKEYDDGLAECSLKAAEEDFAFARQRFAQTGVEPFHMYEHTYGGGLSQYYAVSVWAASCLYQASGEEEYAAWAREYGEKLIRCQEQDAHKAPIPGFFYRDENHKTIVHFNHQAREHQFMQALEALCLTQPERPEREKWEHAMSLYGGYLKSIAGNTAPYGMLPAGVHKLDEPDDRELFPYMHPCCEYEAERENYRAQLKAGTDLGGGYVLRNFPVWFSFRGNTAVMLSMGKAAGILGRYFGDGSLLQIAKEQLYWLWGKNPFGQSLVYGMGRNYCRQYAVLTGESVGEVPVGVETLENGDEPYWPQNNNATFREVWVSAACRYIQTLEELLSEEESDE